MTTDTQTLCSWCSKAGSSCEAYPTVTMTCIEFDPTPRARTDACLALARIVLTDHADALLAWDVLHRVLSTTRDDGPVSGKE